VGRAGRNGVSADHVGRPTAVTGVVGVHAAGGRRHGIAREGRARGVIGGDAVGRVRYLVAGNGSGTEEVEDADRTGRLTLHVVDDVGADVESSTTRRVYAAQEDVLDRHVVNREVVV